MEMEDFIEEVRKNPCLYDRGERYTYDAEKRETIWASLSAQFNLDAKRRWLTLRERYTKEKKKIEQLEREGNRKQDIWPLFWHLEFLNDHISSRTGRRYINKVSKLEDFIKDVEDNECLYNKQCIQFSDTKIKEAIWKELSDKYNIDAKLKFQFLRERYCRERKKMENNSEYTSAWPYFNLMEFLKDQIITRASRKSFGKSPSARKAPKVFVKEEGSFMYYKEDEEDDDEDPLFKVNTTENSTEFEFKRAKYDDDDALITTLNDIQTKLDNRGGDDDVVLNTLNDIQAKLCKTEEEDDEDWLFLRSLRVKMRKMPNAAKRTFKINMLIQADEATGEM